MLDHAVFFPAESPVPDGVSIGNGGLDLWERHIPQDRLWPSVPSPVVLVLPLAAMPDPRHPAFHSRWRDPDRDLTLLASGPCWPVQATERAAWRSAQDGPLPLLLFQRPFAAHTPPRLSCPAIQCLERNGRPFLLLTGDSRHTAPSRLRQLWQDCLTRLSVPQPVRAGAFCVRRSVSTPSRSEWLERVDLARQSLHQGQLRKLVLTRRLDLDLARPVAVGPVFQRLCSDHPQCCVFTLPTTPPDSPDPGTLIAASPERLAVKQGRHITSHALAGTIRRGRTTDEDRTLASQLRQDAKERHEHDLVVQMIAATLAGLSQRCDPLPQPQILPLKQVQHLWSPVSGQLRPDVDLLEAVQALHPTPAVAGSPTAAALDWLHQHGEQRGPHYTGVVGWLNADGDGDGVVVIRCAELRGHHASLWAGAGIVSQSDPEQEWQETELKLSTLLKGLEQA